MHPQIPIQVGPTVSVDSFYYAALLLPGYFGYQLMKRNGVFSEEHKSEYVFLSSVAISTLGFIIAFFILLLFSNIFSQILGIRGTVWYSFGIVPTGTSPEVIWLWRFVLYPAHFLISLALSTAAVIGIKGRYGFRDPGASFISLSTTQAFFRMITRHSDIHSIGVQTEDGSIFVGDLYYFSESKTEPDIIMLHPHRLRSYEGDGEEYPRSQENLGEVMYIKGENISYMWSFDENSIHNF